MAAAWECAGSTDMRPCSPPSEAGDHRDWRNLDGTDGAMRPRALIAYRMSRLHQHQICSLGTRLP